MDSDGGSSENSKGTQSFKLVDISGPAKPKPHTLFSSEPTTEGVRVTLPGGFAEFGAIGTTSKIFPNQEEADQAIELSKTKIGPGTELASLQRSFSTFYRITPDALGKYTVTFPGMYSLDNPGVLVGTSRKTFDSWDQAKNFYLESQNRNEYPEQAAYELKVDGVDYKFAHLNKFGGELHIADKPRMIPETTKQVLDFDARNRPLETEASTYYKTLQIPGWQSQVYRFVENYAQTPEGQQVIGQLAIKDLKLLTPQQAVKLTLEVVTRMKKYNPDEIGTQNGTSESDQNSALTLLNQGLLQRDNADFKGNGICRNFASTVKVVFEGLKANQTRFNYLQNTYALYDSGPRADYDPSYINPQNSEVPTMKSKEPQIGHAWNPFVAIGEKGASQTIVDATWSNVDYDTGQSVKLDYTLARMEKDVYRNLKRKDAQMDVDQAAQFYLYTINSVPKQEGLVLDDEAKARAKVTPLYQQVLAQFQTNYPGNSTEKYEQAALDYYKKVIDQESVRKKTQFYLERATESIRGRENSVTPATGAELTRMVVQTKQDVGYFDVLTVFSLPGSEPVDRTTAATKYVRSWEERNMKGNDPIKNLVFANKDLQEAILQAASEQTKAALLKELATR